MGDISPHSFILWQTYHRPHKPPFSWFAWVIAWAWGIACASCQDLNCNCNWGSGGGEVQLSPAGRFFHYGGLFSPTKFFSPPHKNLRFSYCYLKWDIEVKKKELILKGTFLSLVHIFKRLCNSWLQKPVAGSKF